MTLVITNWNLLKNPFELLDMVLNEAFKVSGCFHVWLFMFVLLSVSIPFTRQVIIRKPTQFGVTICLERFKAYLVSYYERPA